MFKVGKIVFPSAVFFASVFQTANVVHAGEGEEKKYFNPFRTIRNRAFYLEAETPQEEITRSIIRSMAGQDNSKLSYKEKIKMFWELTFDELAKWFWRHYSKNGSKTWHANWIRKTPLRKTMAKIEERLTKICTEGTITLSECSDRDIRISITQDFKKGPMPWLINPLVKDVMMNTGEADLRSEARMMEFLLRIESGDFFADIFREVFIEKNTTAYPSLHSFNDRVPFSYSQIFYGAETFELFREQLFQTFSQGNLCEIWDRQGKLCEIWDRIEALLESRDMMLAIALQETPVDEKSVGELEKFFSDMTKKLETIKESVKNELLNERYCTNPFYQKGNPFIDEKEGQKILDELDERKEEEKKEEKVAPAKQSMELVKYKSNEEWQQEQFIKFKESSNKNL